MESRDDREGLAVILPPVKRPVKEAELPCAERTYSSLRIRSCGVCSQLLAAGSSPTAHAAARLPSSLCGFTRRIDLTLDECSGRGVEQTNATAPVLALR